MLTILPGSIAMKMALLVGIFSFLAACVRSLDKQHLDEAQAQYDQLASQYLDLMPGVDIADVVYNAIVSHGIFGNVDGIPFERFSVFTRLKGLQAALGELVL